MKDQTTKKLSKKLLKIAEDEAQRQSLLFRTEDLIPNKGSDSSLDLLHDKIQLIKGVEISISGLNKYIAETIAEYKPLFTLEFYQQIFRLNGWDVELAKEYNKPPEVAQYTNEIIYGRFPKEILPVIQWRNPYQQYMRREFKNFQMLTDEGREKVKGFIEDSIRVMKSCSAWHEFKVKYATEFGLPFQLSLFDKNTSF